MPLRIYRRWLIGMTLALVLMGAAVVVLHLRVAAQRADDCKATLDVRAAQTQSQVDAWRDAQRLLDPDGSAADEVDELVAGIERRAAATPEPSTCIGTDP